MPEDLYEEIGRLPAWWIDPYRMFGMHFTAIRHVCGLCGCVCCPAFYSIWFEGVKRELGAGSGALSRKFSRRFNVRAGDTIALDGAVVNALVAAVFYDYTSEHGLVMMNRSTFLDLFGDHTINSLPSSLVANRVA
jgi:putative ABC transport system permease protein